MFDPVVMIDAGQVMRWHALPVMNRRLQTNADHQWGVLTILLSIDPDIVTHNVTLHALYHDIGERQSGDLPAPFKKMSEEIAVGHKILEEKFRDKITNFSLPELTDFEKDLVKFADMAEALITILLYAGNPGKVDGIAALVDNLSAIKAKLDDQFEKTRGKKLLWLWCRKYINPYIVSVPNVNMITPF